LAQIHLITAKSCGPTFTEEPEFQGRVQRFPVGAGPGKWLFDVPDSDYPAFASAQVFMSLTNLAHAYRAVGLDSPQSAGVSPIHFCIVTAPTGLQFSPTAYPMASAPDVRRCTNLTAMADCVLCVRVMEDSTLRYKCAAEIKDRYCDEWNPHTAAWEAHPALCHDPDNGIVASCDMSVAGQPRLDGYASGVCTIIGPEGGGALPEYVRWVLGAFYRADGSPRAR
jgi:hypothetical protein